MPPLIKNYTFGKLVLGDKIYEKDLIITPTEIHSPWWRKEGHYLRWEDIEPWVKGVEILIVGSGYYGVLKVDDDVEKNARKMGVEEVIVCPTAEACGKYNSLVGVKKVVAAFHLTC